MIVITIVTVNFNNVSELNKTYLSMKNNNLLNSCVEWVIIDGASTDGSINLISKIINENVGCNIKAISEKDSGIYDAMNKGIKLARGMHTIFMNSGDCFHERSLNFFLSQPRDANILYYGNADFYNHDELAFHFKANMAKQREFLKHNCFSHQAIFYPTTLIKKLNGYRLTYKISADFDLTWRSILSGCHFEHLRTVIADCALGGISCQRGLQSYRDRMNCFNDTGAHFFGFLLLLYYPMFFFKNRVVGYLEGSRLISIYRKLKVR